MGLAGIRFAARIPTAIDDSPGPLVLLIPHPRQRFVYLTPSGTWPLVWSLASGPV